jgi:predicted aspartyl protease
VSTFYKSIEVGDPSGQRFETVVALVDTGSTFTVIPASTLRRLGVTQIRSSQFELGDGKVVEWAVGETRVKLNDMVLSTQVVFGPDDAEPILGAVTLEEFLLAPDSVRGELIPVPGLARSLRRPGSRSRTP